MDTSVQVNCCWRTSKKKWMMITLTSFHMARHFLTTSKLLMRFAHANETVFCRNFMSCDHNITLLNTSRDFWMKKFWLHILLSHLVNSVHSGSVHNMLLYLLSLNHLEKSFKSAFPHFSSTCSPPWYQQIKKFVDLIRRHNRYGPQDLYNSKCP